MAEGRRAAACLGAGQGSEEGNGLVAPSSAELHSQYEQPASACIAEFGAGSRLALPCQHNGRTQDGAVVLAGRACSGDGGHQSCVNGNLGAIVPREPNGKDLQAALVKPLDG